MSEPRRATTRDSLLAEVDRVAATARLHAAESERLRTLAPPVVAALREGGLFACVAPRELGGGEIDPLTQVEVFEAMARADTSAGWSLMIGAILSAMLGAYLPERGAARVFAGAFPIGAGLLQPGGVARRAPGGFIIEGRWPFGSGIRHADWVFTSAVVAPSDSAPLEPGPPAMVSVAVPAAQVRIEDTWDTSGLRGSGSEHYRLDGVFVGDDFATSFPGPLPRRGGALYTLPFVALTTPGHVGFALGVARRALDEITAAAPQRLKLWPGKPLASHEAFQIDLGRAEARLGAARAYALEVLGAMWDRARARQPLSLEDWAAIRLVTTHVTEVAAEVVSFAYRSGGGSALYASSPLQRCFRDIHAATQHIAATDDAYEFAGRVRLGIAEAHPLLAPRA